MKIFVCLKPVVNEDLIKIDSDGNIIRENIELIPNKADDYAIENAILIKKKNNASVVGLIMGPENSKEVAKYAISRGCDEVILISDPKLKASDSLITSKVLSTLIKKLALEEKNYAVFCGVSSDDAHTSIVPAQISYFLKLPLIYAALRCDISDSSIIAITSQAKITCRLPAVVSFDISNEIKPSISPLNLRLKSKTYTPSIFTLKDIELDITGKDSPSVVDSIFVENKSHSKKAEILDITKKEDIEKIKKIIYE